VQDIVFQS
jgi:hypothetical protein